MDADALEFPHAVIASTMRQENKTTINLCFNIVVCITIGPFSKEVFVKGFLYIMRKRREKSLSIQSEVIINVAPIIMSWFTEWMCTMTHCSLL